MPDDRLFTAMSKLEQVAAALSPSPPSGSVDATLAERHAALRHAVAEAVAALDGVLAELGQ